MWLIPVSYTPTALLCSDSNECPGAAIDSGSVFAEVGGLACQVARCCVIMEQCVLGIEAEFWPKDQQAEEGMILKLERG